MPTIILVGIMMIRGEKWLSCCVSSNGPSEANCFRVSSNGNTVFSHNATRNALAKIADSDSIAQLKPIRPRWPMTCGLVPIFRPITSIRMIRAILIRPSNPLRTASGRPLQLISAPIPKQTNGIIVFIVSPRKSGLISSINRSLFLAITMP